MLWQKDTKTGNRRKMRRGLSTVGVGVTVVVGVDGEGGRLGYNYIIIIMNEIFYKR